jgi:phosphatidylglycerol:prolipoprotein diacylglycerol transferase
MYPHLPHALGAYSTFLAIGVVTGVAIGTWRLRALGLGASRSLGLELLLALTGLAGAKLYVILERGHVLSPWAEMTGSYRYPGGIIAVVVVFLVAHRRLLRGVSLGMFADAVAPATGIALAIVRLGCFAHGCCFGRPAALPWAVAFPAHSLPWNSQLAAGQLAETAVTSLPVHPLQLYFAAASMGVALFVWWLAGRTTVPGQAALVFLLLDGLAKLGLETLRGEPMVHLQLAALATAVAAGAVLLVKRKMIAVAPVANTRSPGAPVHDGRRPPLTSPPHSGGDAGSVNAVGAAVDAG